MNKKKGLNPEDKVKELQMQLEMVEKKLLKETAARTQAERDLQKMISSHSHKPKPKRSSSRKRRRNSSSNEEMMERGLNMDDYYQFNMNNNFIPQIDNNNPLNISPIRNNQNFILENRKDFCKNMPRIEEEYSWEIEKDDVIFKRKLGRGGKNIFFFFSTILNNLFSLK